jgi:hypothetical protein
MHNIRCKKSLLHAWKDGATMFVVTAKNGLHVICRNKVKDANELYTLLKEYFNNKECTVHSN